MCSYKGYTNFEINLKGGKYSTLMEKSIFVTTCRFGIIFCRFYVFFPLLSPPILDRLFFYKVVGLYSGIAFFTANSYLHKQPLHLESAHDLSISKPLCYFVGSDKEVPHLIKQITGSVWRSSFRHESRKGHAIQHLGQEVVFYQAPLAQEGSLSGEKKVNHQRKIMASAKIPLQISSQV